MNIIDNSKQGFIKCFLREWKNIILIIINMKNETQSNLKYPRRDAQHYHEEIKRLLNSLTYKEKFNIIKKVDKDLLKKVNTFNGTKAVHTLDYVSLLPYKKKDLNLTEEILLNLRSLFMMWSVKEYYNEKRKKMIRIVKWKKN